MLLAIFAIGLLAAWMIVNIRGRVVLSAPIVLDGSGLAVSVPAGAGWEHTPAWVYESDNSMTLLAQRRLMKQAEVELRWRYMLGAAPMDLEEVLKERLAGSTAKIDALEMPAGSMMKAARVSTPGAANEPVYYIALAPLAQGRSIELHVIPKRMDFDLFYAETLLTQTAQSMIYQTTQEALAGAAMLEQFCRTKNNSPLEESFLISESSGRTTGYFSAQQENRKDDIRKIVSRHYDAQQFLMESSLQFNPAEGQFTWETRLMTPMTMNPRLYQISQEDAHHLKVTSNYEKDKTLYVDSCILPELLLTEFVQLYQPSGAESVVTVVLAGTGQIVPVRVKRVSPQEAGVKLDDVSTVVRVEYLHSADYYDEFYVNNQGRVIGRFERQPRRQDRLWKQANPEEIKKMFGGKPENSLQAAPKPKEYI
jgi:hypothetical protein